MTKVIFALDPQAFSNVEPDTIVISPNRESWDDFGFRIRVDIAFFTKFSRFQHFRLPGFFGFLGNSKYETDVGLLEQLLEAAPGRTLEAKDLPAFFTMLPHMGAYRELVSYLGPEAGATALIAIKEIVAMGERMTSSNWLRDVHASQVFKKGFLRSSEAFFAWANAGSVLSGLEHEQLGRISDTFNIRYQLAGRPNEHNLSFRFDVNEEILPRRFAVVIGENGVGKSQALGNIAKAALDGSKRLTDAEGSRPSLNRLLAFAPTSTTSSVFPSDRRRNPKVWYRRFALGHCGVTRGRYMTADLIMRLARSEERIRSRSRFEILLTAIAVIDRGHELGFRASRDYHADFIHFGELQKGDEEDRIERFGAIDLRREPIRIIDGQSYPLSSGEQSFLRFAAIASLYIENGTLVLLDEPETHLHPRFISQFVAVLNNLLEQTGSAAIIATHSVYFVREAFEDQVIVLRSAKDRSIIAEPPTLKTFGADVGSISYFVFGEDEPSRLALEAERRITDGSSSWELTFEKYKDELSLELLAEIRARLEPSKPARGQ